MSGDGYVRFVQWAKRDDAPILSEAEYNERVSKYRIRLSPVEQEIQRLEGEMARIYREFQENAKQLRAKMTAYREEIERDLRRR